MDVHLLDVRMDDTDSSVVGFDSAVNVDSVLSQAVVPDDAGLPTLGRFAIKTQSATPSYAPSPAAAFIDLPDWGYQIDDLASATRADVDDFLVILEEANAAELSLSESSGLSATSGTLTTPSSVLAPAFSVYESQSSSGGSPRWYGEAEDMIGRESDGSETHDSADRSPSPPWFAVDRQASPSFAEVPVHAATSKGSRHARSSSASLPTSARPDGVGVMAAPSSRRRPLSEQELLALNLDQIAANGVASVPPQTRSELKRLRRRVKNMLSAAESRDRKRQYLQDLETQLEQSQSKIAELSKLVEDLTAENRRLSQQLEHAAASTPPSSLVGLALASAERRSTRSTTNSRGVSMLMVALFLSFGALLSWPSALDGLFSGRPATDADASDKSPSVPEGFSTGRRLLFADGPLTHMDLPVDTSAWHVAAPAYVQQPDSMAAWADVEAVAASLPGDEELSNQTGLLSSASLEADDVTPPGTATSDAAFIFSVQLDAAGGCVESSTKLIVGSSPLLEA